MKTQYQTAQALEPKWLQNNAQIYYYTPNTLHDCGKRAFTCRASQRTQQENLTSNMTKMKHQNTRKSKTFWCHIVQQTETSPLDGPEVAHSRDLSQRNCAKSAKESRGAARGTRTRAVSQAKKFLERSAGGSSRTENKRKSIGIPGCIGIPGSLKVGRPHLASHRNA